MPYNNPIVAGVQLVIPSIQSPDYVTGVSGWAVFRDGTVEFNNGTFRGDLIVGSPTGTNVEITQTLPPALSAHYGSILNGLSQYCILMTPGSGAIHYEIVGYILVLPDTEHYYACGWIDGTTSNDVHEQINQTYTGGTSRLTGTGFGANNRPGDKSLWNFGTRYAAAKTNGNHTFNVFDTDIFLGDVGVYATAVGSVNFGVPLFMYRNVTLLHGGLTVSAGNIVMAAGNFTITSGNASLNNGNLTVGGTGTGTNFIGDNTNFINDVVVQGQFTAGNIRGGSLAVTPTGTGPWRVTTPVTFTSAMPSTVTAVSVSLVPHSGVPDNCAVGISGTPTRTGFSFVFARTDGATTTTVDWMAIGR